MTYEKFIDVETAEIPDEIELDNLDDVELLEFEEITDDELNELEITNAMCDIYKGMSDYYRAVAESGIHIDNGLNKDYEIVKAMINARNGRVS